MMLFTIITIFCLIWRIKATDESLSKDTHQTVADRDSKQERSFLTLQDVKTTAPKGVHDYLDTNYYSKILDDNSQLPPKQYKLEDKTLHYTRSRVSNSHSSLKLVRWNKQLNQLFVTGRTSAFLTSQLPNITRRRNNVPYHRGRRDRNSPRISGSVAAQNGNLISPEVYTAPKDEQGSGSAEKRSGSLVSFRSGNFDISETGELSTSGHTVTDTPSSGVQRQEELNNGQVQHNESDGVREPLTSQQVNRENTISTSGTSTSDPQGSAPRADVSGSQPGNTPEVNAQSGVVDHPIDVARKDPVVVGPVDGTVEGNVTERRNQSYTNLATNSYGSINTSTDYFSSGDSPRNGSNSISVNEANSNLSSNVSSPMGALSPAVISDNRQKNEQITPSSQQEYVTEENKSLSDLNSSDAINPINYVSISLAASESTNIVPSLRHLDSSLTATLDSWLLFSTQETLIVLETGPTVLSELTVHSVTHLVRPDEGVLSSSANTLHVSPVSNIFTRDISHRSRSIHDSEASAHTSLIQPTVALLPTPLTQTYAAQFASFHSSSPIISRAQSDVGILIPDETVTASNINEPLQSSMPTRIAASSISPFISFEITPVLIPHFQTTDQTSDSITQSTSPAESAVTAVTPLTSRPGSAVTTVPERASSRDTTSVVPLHDTSIPTVAARPSGDPPPIRHDRPDEPDLPEPVSTETHRMHPNTDADETVGKVTSRSVTSSQEEVDRQLSPGTSFHTSTVKSTLSGNTTRNETDYPRSYMELKLSMSWPNFCRSELAIRQELVDILQVHVRSVGIAADQIQVMDRESVNCFQEGESNVAEILVRMYLTNLSHHFDRNLTLQCATILKAGIPFDDRKNSIIKTRLLAINLYDGDDGQEGPTTRDSNLGNEKDINSDDSADHRVTLAIALAVVGGCCCIGLIILQVVVRRRNKDSRNSPMPSINSSYTHSSSDSIQLASVIKSRPNSGLMNPGLDILEPPDPSHPMNFMQLSNFCMDESKIAEEYQKLPQRLPRPSMVPAGEEDKNRYANILPLVHTRVKLVQDGPAPRSSYINANYVTGPNNQCQYYIATQAPTENTTADFWTMIWQQECQTIVMLTDMEEQGQIKCVSYWPELVGKSAAHKYGDFLIELIGKDVHQEYIVSRLEINNQRKIETRQIDHFWYTCWPPHGLPEPISLVKLVLDIRPKYESGTSPLVVHCSPGTGRTCTFIALDLCMRQFETRRIVDIMKTVNSIRQERAGAIQNKEQYVLLYNAVHEYAAIVMTPGISATSSAATLQALLPN